MYSDVSGEFQTEKAMPLVMDSSLVTCVRDSARAKHRCIHLFDNILLTNMQPKSSTVAPGVPANQYT